MSEQTKEEVVVVQEAQKEALKSKSLFTLPPRDPHFYCMPTLRHQR